MFARRLSIKAGSSIAKVFPSGVSTSTINSAGQPRSDLCQRKFLRFTQVDWPRGFLRISETRTVSNHLALIASGEKRKSLWTRRTFESKKAIAINSCVAGEHFIHLFSAHTFDRITPKAFHCSDGTRFIACSIVSVRSQPGRRSLALPILERDQLLALAVT